MSRPASRAASCSALLLAGRAIVPYFVGLGGSAIWDANEAFYVETPREMIERGDYVSPDLQLPAAAQQAGPELLDRRRLLQGCSASRSACSGLPIALAPWADPRDRVLPRLARLAGCVRSRRSLASKPACGRRSAWPSRRGC